MLILYIAICSLLAKSQSCSVLNAAEIDIVCKSIGAPGYQIVNPISCCYGDSSITVTFSDSTVRSILNQNKLEMENLAEIKGLYIVRATVKFIPTGIKNKIKNLKLLGISSCGLLSINKENLKEFGSTLELLDLYGNKITSIESDLLEYNPNLIAFYLNGNNPIKHIDPEFFINLKKLKNILLIEIANSGCTTNSFRAATSKLAAFQWNREICVDETAKTETRNLIKKHTSSNVKFCEIAVVKIEDSVKDLAKSMQSDFNKLNSDYLKAHEQMNNLMQENKNLRKDNQAIKDKIDLMSQEFKNQKDQLESILKILM